MVMRQDGMRAAMAGVLALAACAAQAMTDAELTQRLQARFAGDRTGVCVAAAVIEGAQVEEMVDIANGFLAWRDRLPKGKRIGICTGSGGGGADGASDRRYASASSPYSFILL